MRLFCFLQLKAVCLEGKWCVCGDRGTVDSSMRAPITVEERRNRMPCSLGEHHSSPVGSIFGWRMPNLFSKFLRPVWCDIAIIAFIYDYIEVRFQTFQCVRENPSHIPFICLPFLEQAEALAVVCLHLFSNLLFPLLILQWCVDHRLRNTALNPGVCS